jgi:hypothetical protein
MLRDLEATAGTQIETIQHALFDQDTGVFGFLKEVTTLNGKSRTVIDGFASLLESLFGGSGFFTEVGEKLRGMGLNTDPMKALYDGIMTVTSWAKGAADALDSVSLSDIGERLKPEQIGKTLADLIDSALAKLGQAGASIDYGKLFSSIGTGIGAAFKGLGSFLMNLDWSTYVTAGLAILGGILATFAINAIGVALAAAISSAVIAFAASSTAAAIAAVVAATVGFPVLVAAGVGLLVVGLVKAIVDNWSAITQWFSNTWTWIKDSAVNAFNSVKDWIGGVINKVITSIGSTFTSFIGSVQNSVQRIVESVQTWFQDSVERIKGFLANPIGTVKGMVTGQAVSNHAAGLNVGSLFSAIARETALMPSGSNLAIANTSETILNRAQQRDLVSLVSATRTRGGSTFAPQIVVNPAPGMNEESLANLVMNQIEQRWNQYQLSSL